MASALPSRLIPGATAPEAYPIYGLKGINDICKGGSFRPKKKPYRSVEGHLVGLILLLRAVDLPPTLNSE